LRFGDGGGVVEHNGGLLLKNYEIPGGDFTTRRFVFVATVLLVCYNAVVYDLN
jgi:hypothetical protein